MEVKENGWDDRVKWIEQGKAEYCYVTLPVLIAFGFLPEIELSSLSHGREGWRREVVGGTPLLRASVQRGA